MVTDTEKTAVMFRKEYDGEILAVFPYLSYMCSYQITGYAHIGQHCHFPWEYVEKDTTPAMPEEFKSLYDELTSIGHNLKVLLKPNYHKMYRL